MVFRKRHFGRGPLAVAVAAAAVAVAVAFAVVAGSASGASGGTLTLTRISDDTAGFGPVRQSTGNDAMINSLIFSNLVKIAPDEKTVVPDLADRWTVSKDAKVFTFFLHKGVKWSDGQPFTAKDVVFTITQAAQLGPSPYIGYQPTEWRQVLGADKIVGTTKPLAGVKAIGDYTVRLTLAQPNAVFVRNLTDAVYAIVPQHLLASATAKTIVTMPFTTSKPVGTGPYILQKYVPNQYVEFKANPDYFRGPAKIQTVFFKLNVKPETAVAQLESGELQFALDLNPNDAPRVQGLKSVKSEFVASPAAEFLQFRTDDPQASDPRVRQAIYYAVDRRQMLKNLVGGHGVIRWTMPGFDQTEPSLNRYPYDPAKAKQLLKAANFDFSKPFQLLYAPDADPLWQQMGPVVQKYLKDVGMNVQLQPVDAAGWTSALVNQKPTFPLTLQSGGSMGLLPDRSSIYFNCKTPLQTFYANCNLDALYAKARGQADPAQAAKTYAQVAKILNQQLPYATLWMTENLDAYTKKLSGVKIYSNDRDTLFGITSWTLKG